MKTNKNGVKLLATVMVFAIALAGVVVIFGGDEYDAEETKTYTDIEGGDFKEIKPIGEYIVLDKNYNLKSSIVLGTASEILKIDLNGFEIKGSLGDLIYVTADGCTIEIKDSKGTGSMVNEITPSNSVYGSIVNAACVDVEGKETLPDKVSLTVNGGTYRGDRLFVIGSGNDTDENYSTTVFQNAKMFSTEYALWLSFGTHSSSVVDNCEITAKYGGIYFATVTEVTMKNTTIISDETGVEIKMGTVNIDGCNITSKTYIDSTSVGYSQSGGAVSSIVINNAYSSGPITVNIDKDSDPTTGTSTITNTTGKSPVVATIDYDKAQSITVNWDKHTADVKPIYIKEKTGATLNTNGIITINGTKYVSDQARVISGATVALCGDVTLSGTLSFTSIDLNGYKLTLAGESTISGDVVGKNGSKATFESYAIPAKTSMVLSSGSIIIESTGEEVAITGTGIINITGDAKVVGDTIINGTINLKNNAKLTIPEGTSLKATSITQDAGVSTKVIVEGKLDATVGTTNTYPVVEVSSGAEVEGVDEGAITYNKDGSQTAIGNILTSDLEISTKWYLSNDLVIPEGITVNIVSGGELNLANNNIIVFGTLNIDAGGMIASTNGTEKIYLTKGCEFSNEGTVGLGSADVTVSVDKEEINGKLDNIAGGADYKVKYTAAGEVIVNSVVGIEFSIVKKTTTPSVTYTLAVGGDLTTDLESASVTLDGCFISSDLTISENIIATVTNAVIQKDVTVTVDGELAISGTLTMTNKATVIVNGYVHGTITAQTGTYETSAGYSAGTTTVGFEAVDPAVAGIYAKNEGVTGIILSVGTYAFIDNTTETPVAKTSQRLYIEGSADYVTIQNNNTTAAYDKTNLAIEGNAAYVADDAVLSLKTGMIVTNANAIVVEGAIISADKIDTAVPKYVGTSFAIKTATTPAVTTYYIKPFDVAITEIDAADKKTLTVKDKEVEIASELILTEGQIIDIYDAVDFYISENGIVTVNSKAKITGTIGSVDGILKIMTGGVCSKPASYASEIKNTGYTQYSGLQIALKNAQAGETIYVNKETTLRSGDLEVKEGVTVIANENITVKDGNVNVDGKLVMKDGKKIELQAEKKNIDVGENGELDASEGIVKLSTDGKINTDGKTVIAQADTLDLAEYVNGFVYIDEDGNKVITDAQTVIDAAAAKDTNKNVTVYGKVSVGDITVKTKLIIDEKATVTVGNATISAGKTVTLTGKTTGTFSAQTGTEETVGAIETSVISVTEASGITIGAGKTVDSMNVETKVMYIFGTLVGKATVDDGVVTVGLNGGTATQKKLTVDGTATTEAYLIIAEGATVAIPNGMTLVAGCNDVSGNVYSAVTVDGTLDFAKGATISASAADDCFIVINGTVMIGDEAVFAYDAETILNGKVIVSETATKEGTLSVVENIYAYEESAISGKVTISTGKYIMAMAGADVSAAKMNVDATGTSAAFATAFMINGEKYMDVYTINGVSIFTLINDVDFSIEGLNLSGIGTVTNWYKSETYTDEYKLAAGAVTDKNVPALYFNAPKAEVIGTISAGVGLQIYLNGISVENYKDTGGYKLPVGTYKVNIENLSGYDKSKAVISFNGATVADGGSITISEKDFVLTATGAVPATGGSSSSSSNSDDGMGITDYLLIVLVVLIVIMAILVAIRMMRS